METDLVLPFRNLRCCVVALFPTWGMLLYSGSPLTVKFVSMLTIPHFLSHENKAANDTLPCHELVMRRVHQHGVARLSECYSCSAVLDELK